MSADQRNIKAETADRNADQRRENADVKNGNIAGAQKMDAARHHEQHEINAQKKELSKDKNDLAHDRKDRNKDVAARKDERNERNSAVVKRNKDASKIK